MAVDDAYTKILFHFDGDDEATDIIDEAGTAWTNTGTNQLDTAQKKFGASSLLIKGTSLFEYTGAVDDFNPAAGNFTIDFWARFSVVDANMEFMPIEIYSNDTYDRLNVTFWNWGAGVNALELYIVAGGVAYYVDLGDSVPFVIPIDEWIHYEVCRSGNSYLLFINGTLYDTVTIAAHTIALTGDGWIQTMFRHSSMGDVWVDEFRYSKGIARHTTSFTPPVEEYEAPPPDPSYLEETINERLDFTEGMASQVNSDPTYHDITLLDFLGLAGLSAYMVPVEEELTDGLGLADSILKSLTMNPAIIDTLFSYDNANVGWNKTVNETLDIAETLNVTLGLIISEWLTIIDTETNNWNGREIIAEPLNLYDLAAGSRHYADTLTDTVDMADAAALKLTVAILEHLGFADLATALKTMAQALSDGLGLSDASAWAFPLSVTDALSCVDAATVATAFLQSVQSSMAFADTITPIKRVGHTVTESLVFADTVGSQGTFYNVLYDTLAMNVLVELDGEIYECYVLSTPKFMPSIYSGFDFNSYAVFQNRAFGANSTGIYELTGDTDAGAAINTGVILSGTDFGSHNQKRFRKGFLDISGDAPLMIFETDEGNRRVYTVDTKGKIMASHEQKSKKWKLSLARFDSLESIQLVPIILTK